MPRPFATCLRHAKTRTRNALVVQQTLALYIGDGRVRKQQLLGGKRFGLCGEVSSVVIVDPVNLERVVAQVAPQNGEHPQFMRTMECLGDFDDLMM